MSEIIDDRIERWRAAAQFVSPPEAVLDVLTALEGSLRLQRDFESLYFAARDRADRADADANDAEDRADKAEAVIAGIWGYLLDMQRCHVSDYNTYLSIPEMLRLLDGL